MSKDVLLELNKLKAKMHPFENKSKSKNLIEQEKAVADGKPLIYARGASLKYAGKVYNRGDAITLGAGRSDKALVGQGWFVLPGTWEAAKVYNQYKKKYQDEIQPQEAIVLKERTGLTVLAADLAQAQYNLDVAQRNIREQKSMLANSENKLAALIK